MKPARAGSYARFACPLCKKVVRRHVPKLARTVVSWCSTKGKQVLLERVP